MPERRWKATERRIAALLGGKRVPVSGRGRGDAPDVAHPWLSIEVQDRASLPAWLVKALAQAEAAATPDQLSAIADGGRERGGPRMPQVEEVQDEGTSPS